MEPRKQSNDLFWSLPHDIVLDILARIPRPYYPTLTLVSKSFRSILLSKELYKFRSQLGTLETCFYVCFQRPTRPCEREWSSLWIKPDDHQILPYPTSIVNSTGNCLLPMVQKYVGSETYKVSGDNNVCSSDVWVVSDNLDDAKWLKAPSMSVARKNPLTCTADGKFYVMGGCEPDESTYWAEVFDPKTQTWEPLPDPGVDLRFSINRSLDINLGEGLIYVMSTKRNLYFNKYVNIIKENKEEKKKSFAYEIKENRWTSSEDRRREAFCLIDHVTYSYDDNQVIWFDTKRGPRGQWRLVQGLSELHQHSRIDTQIGNYGGKLLLIWDCPPSESALVEIRCAVILLDKRQDGEIWGQIEWTDHVLSLPRNYILLHCEAGLEMMWLQK